MPSAKGFAKQAPEAGLQKSCVHGLLSSHPLTWPPHTPPAHLSPAVHNSPSLQAIPSGPGLCRQAPLTESHVSSVHGSVSEQSRIGPEMHRPRPHMSKIVQKLPSSHATPVRGTKVHRPLAATQPSWVQGLPSLQVLSAPARHAPPLQTSPRVHKLPSLHGKLLFACWQPSLAEQLSWVQGLPSSQFCGAPPTHTLPLQRSPLVQMSPSSHGPPLPMVW